MRIKIYRKNRPILFYAIVHTANGLYLMGSFRHAALLFVHTLVVHSLHVITCILGDTSHMSGTLNALNGIISHLRLSEASCGTGNRQGRCGKNVILSKFM